MATLTLKGVRLSAPNDPNRAKKKIKGHLELALEAAADEGKPIVVQSLYPSRTMMALVTLCAEQHRQFNRPGGSGNRLLFPNKGKITVRKKT